MQTTVKIRIRDRIGVVNEICGIIQSLDIGIVRHGAKVSTDRSGLTVSDFKAQLDSDRPEDIRILQRRCERIRGFISFSA